MTGEKAGDGKKARLFLFSQGKSSMGRASLDRVPAWPNLLRLGTLGSSHSDPEAAWSQTCRGPWLGSRRNQPGTSPKPPWSRRLVGARWVSGADAAVQRAAKGAAAGAAVALHSDGWGSRLSPFFFESREAGSTKKAHTQIGELELKFSAFLSPLFFSGKVAVLSTLRNFGGVPFFAMATRRAPETGASFFRPHTKAEFSWRFSLQMTKKGTFSKRHPQNFDHPGDEWVQSKVELSLPLSAVGPIA